jgi:SAM-dependent methyltransferase
VLLTITTTRAPATDLGYLLFKHPGKVQSWPVASGQAHVFYPEAEQDRCTAALLLEVDPVALVRGKKNGKGNEPPGITHYVNDRPYAASSLLAVALKEVFGTALTGRCDARPELAASPIPLEIRVPALRCSAGSAHGGGAGLATALFAPLGWAVTAEPVPLDPPEWGTSRYVDLRLDGTVRLADALNHLYVLLPVLDDAKHYWVTSDEIDKLVRAGAGWLAAHPDKALITRRYLAHRRELTVPALARLAEADDLAPEELDNAVPDEGAGDEEQAGGVPAADGRQGCDRGARERREEAVHNGTPEAERGLVCSRAGGTEPKPVPLAVQRRDAVLAVLRESGARSVGDLGCGDGALTKQLISEKGIDRVIAADVSARALAIAARRLRLERLSEAKRATITLIQSALTYRDERLTNLDAAVLMEVIEHVDDARLPALERAVFGFAAPSSVIVTTPNAEHNAVYGMAPGALRHPDHRWEWTRAQFRRWAGQVAATYGYSVRFAGAGPEAPEAGQPTQLAVFTKQEAA